MPKFRSMRTDTPVVATHLLTDSRRWITPVGQMLRVTSLDELPQLWCILMGQMSFVGPRPALFNQHDLIEMRTQLASSTFRPVLPAGANQRPRRIAFGAESALGRLLSGASSFRLGPANPRPDGIESLPPRGNQTGRRPAATQSGLNASIQLWPPSARRSPDEMYFLGRYAHSRW